MSTRIVVIDGYTLNPGDNSWQPVAALAAIEIHDRTPPGQIVARAAAVEIIVTNKAPLSAETIAQLPKLKFIAVTATGYNMVDIDAARRSGVVVSNVPVYGTTTVAQFTWALILELCHHVGRHGRSVAAGDWTQRPDFCYWLTPQIELAGKCLGIVGYGRIGQQVAAIGQAFGMHVVACGRPDTERGRGGDGERASNGEVRWLALEQLFAESDIVSLHCPLTPQSERMVNRDLLKRMRREAFLINTARGGLVDELALADALRAGQIAGAAVDVVSVEPIQPDNSLISAPNCLITPHMAWTSLAARRRIMQVTAENIAAFLAGSPQNVVS